MVAEEIPVSGENGTILFVRNNDVCELGDEVGMLTSPGIVYVVMVVVIGTTAFGLLLFIG